MAAETCHIQSLSFSIGQDAGHGGVARDYKLTKTDGEYKVATTYSMIPRHSKPDAKPLEKKVTSHKDPQTVYNFSRTLIEHHHIYELADLKAKVFLHPTFYTIDIQDDCGRRHHVEYAIEASQHLDQRYEAMVKALEQFFDPTYHPSVSPFD